MICDVECQIFQRLPNSLTSHRIQATFISFIPNAKGLSFHKTVGHADRVQRAAETMSSKCNPKS
jgi:hypothetical protein